MLAPVIADARERGRAVRALVHGTAREMWSALPVPCDVAESEDVSSLKNYFAQRKPGFVLTGTSHYSDLERNAWVAARQLGIASACAIDTWVNFPERFVHSDGTFVQPDHICVIDEASRAMLCADGRVTATTHVCGQPHLEWLVTSLAGACAAKPSNGTLNVVFFSNPTAYGAPAGEPRFDQFRAADLLSNALAARENVKLLIKPHPREELSGWEQWIARREGGELGRVALSELSSDELLVAGDAICGITSMTLMEAALLGRPVLALRLGGLRGHNPVMEQLKGVRVAVSEAQVPTCVGALLDDARDGGNGAAEAPGFIRGARQNYARLLDRLLVARQ